MIREQGHIKKALKLLIDFFEESHDSRLQEAINELHIGLDLLND